MRLHFLVLPHVHLLDLSGPVQAFYEANTLGGSYAVGFCSPTPRVTSAQGLTLADLAPPGAVEAGDRVIVAGIDSATLDRLDQVPRDWLRAAESRGAQVASICSGAFALGEAGLLDGRQCTTHWKIAERLQQRYPSCRVVQNRLFVEDGGVMTSAGVASGIDLALALIEHDHGPLVAARVARELVIWVRRDGGRAQQSVYLDYRTHLHPGVHRVQDWLIAHPERKPKLDDLAEIAALSPRHLTRVFRQATGVTLKSFANRLKLEMASNLLHNPELTLEGIASQCGFEDPRQLRRLWKQAFGSSPSEWRQQQESRRGVA